MAAADVSDEGCGDAAPVQPLARQRSGTPPRRRAQRPHVGWQPSEVAALVAGVSHLGRGAWVEIKALEQPAAALGAHYAACTGTIAEALRRRAPVDLKDKWRNLQRTAEMAVDPDALGPHSKPRRDANGGELPPALLAAVRQLALPLAAKTAPRRLPAPPGPPAPPWGPELQAALASGVARAGGLRWTVILKMAGGEGSPEAALAAGRYSAADLREQWSFLTSAAWTAGRAMSPLLARVAELDLRYRVNGKRARGAEDAPWSPGKEEEG